jgi:hypothetical protein
MFTNIYIYVLEVVTALLVIATAVQVSRCYRSFYQTTQTSKISSPAVITPSLPDQTEKSYSTSGDILHDYIGEFFLDNEDPITAQLKQYQVTEKIMVESAEPVSLKAEIIKHNGIQERSSDVVGRSNVLSFDDSLDEKTLAEDDDDTVITVMTSPVTNSGAIKGNVMSDKVVHAMLDEAKLACVS